MKFTQTPRSAGCRPKPNTNLRHRGRASNGSPGASTFRSTAPTWVFGLLSAVLLLAGTAPVGAQGGVPSAINYQGKLTKSDSSPVTSGAYEVAFRIWDHATASGDGNYIWGRSFPLTVVSNGTFNVLLSDDGNPLTSPGDPQAASLLQAFESPDRFLGLTVTRSPVGPVDSAAEISPRQQLVTAPYAIHAQQATLAGTASYATNANAAGFATLAGNAAYATNAASAATATTATNATKFGNLNPSDYLQAKNSSQTLTGALTVNGPVQVNGATVLAGDVNVAGGNVTLATAVTGTPGANLTVGGNLRVAGTTTLTGNVSLGGGKPIRLRRYSYPGKHNTRAPNYYDPTDGPYSASQWAGAVVGIKCSGDFEENGFNADLLNFKMFKNTAGNWQIQFDMYFDTANDFKDIIVDVMWIRNELVDDTR